MNVEIQFTHDCPNAAVVVQRVKRIAHEGSDVTLKLTVIGNGEPVPQGFVGSPTVLIDGRNVFGGVAVDAAACALRPPTADQVESALRPLRPSAV